MGWLTLSLANSRPAHNQMDTKHKHNFSVDINNRITNIQSLLDWHVLCQMFFHHHINLSFFLTTFIPQDQHFAGVITSVAVRYNKSISIIETVISIDYRYIDFLASYFSDRSRGIDRVGDNWRTVNTSANPHISDQLTELENRIHVLNTVMLIYRHDMSCGLQ